MADVQGGSPRERVAVAVFDGVELLDVTGPVQVFSTADRLAPGPGRYRPVLVAERPGPVRSAAGPELVAQRSWNEPVGTLVVPGGLEAGADGVRPLLDGPLVELLARSGRGAARILSVCTGAHVLAAAGLLDGRRATTHWATAAALAAEHPRVRVTPDALFVRDGPVWTSAGVASGIDLALAVVALDRGPDIARRVAQWMVVHLNRPGGQSQFSAHLGPRVPLSDRLAGLLAWISADPTRDLSADALARRLGVGPRHLARLFRRELGATPAAHVERVRLQVALDLLVRTDMPLPGVATAAGFGSTTALHRCVVRRHGVSPGEYRRRFGAGPAAD
ncbi:MULTISPECIES: GlxA family transcriptional regulator [Pseudonocardia]|uniref:HTH-type transcriptional regulator CdhR n=2 Tax=Pseudonocardia TaxID=1847 RepID=A0A1Y2N5J5_PSEAH|nr:MULTISPECIES: helix-turn-helix domain-containing protein [Pseudonocardia]OSY42743.1 HTH-type transcriptional regulator CdhR [Pseudonocardia autotrophica]TDN77320.1 AraC family transcriptional regulator with amidase-like domain [Pseudonocardia autotrophica]BBG01342.1 transcriptional regulator [Pseudonocardia autotrophica]GEC24398.1 transcriptional regulator [Pseudonocardia saturnea]